MNPLTLNDWATIVTAIATVALAIYAAIQLFLMQGELKESKESRNATVVLYIYQLMENLREKWHVLYTFPEDDRTWNDQQKKLADQVGVGLQQVAFLVESGLIDERYIIENWAGTFVNCWHKLENFVKDYRESYGEPRNLNEGAFQRRHLEILAEKCEKYLKTKFRK